MQPVIWGLSAAFVLSSMLHTWDKDITRHFGKTPSYSRLPFLIRVWWAPHYAILAGLAFLDWRHAAGAASVAFLIALTPVSPILGGLLWTAVFPRRLQPILDEMQLDIALPGHR